MLLWTFDPRVQNVALPRPGRILHTLPASADIRLNKIIEMLSWYRIDDFSETADDMKRAVEAFRNEHLSPPFQLPTDDPFHALNFQVARRSYHQLSLHMRQCHCLLLFEFYPQISVSYAVGNNLACLYLCQ